MGKKSYGAYLDESNVTSAMAGVVKRDFGGNFSAYMTELLRRDVEGAPPPLENKPDILVELARHYHPTLAPELKEILSRKRFNEQRIVARVLEALADAMKDEEFDPRTPLVLADAKAVKRWDAVSDERITTAALALAGRLNKNGAAALLQLNEVVATKEEPPRPKKGAGLSRPTPIIPPARPERPSATGS